MKNNIKNLKITKKVTAMALAGTLATAVLTGCGNKQNLDFNKSFNVALETNNGYVSIVAIKGYADFSENQVLFITEDGLSVLTSTHQTQLLKTDIKGWAERYALILAGDDSEKIMDYNEMQGILIDTSSDSVNEDNLEFNSIFDKGIILTDERATIVEIDGWNNYQEDDKIELQLSNGDTIVTDIGNVKLINSDNAQEDSLYNYAVSLIGSPYKVTTVTYTKVKTK